MDHTICLLYFLKYRDTRHIDNGRDMFSFSQYLVIKIMAFLMKLIVLFHTSYFYVLSVAC